jgi:cytochrome c55X
MKRHPRRRRSHSAAIIGAVAAAALAAAASVTGSAADVGADGAAKLTNLVRQDCGSCHGLTLKGGLGKPLTTESLAQWDRDQLAAIILDGVPGTPMPPWRALITEPEARFIADMLKRGALQ